MFCVIRCLSHLVTLKMYYIYGIIKSAVTLIEETASGRLHSSGSVAFGVRPTVVESRNGVTYGSMICTMYGVVNL